METKNKNIKKLTPEEFAALEKAAKRTAEVEERLKALEGQDITESPEYIKLKKELDANKTLVKKQESADQEAARAKLKTELEPKIKDSVHRWNEQRFDNSIPARLVEKVVTKTMEGLNAAELDKWIADTADGQDTAFIEAKKVALKLTESTFQDVRDVQGQTARSTIGYQHNPDVRFNTLDAAKRESGSLDEKGFGSHANSTGYAPREKFKTWVLEAAFKRQIVTKPGVPLLGQPVFESSAGVLRKVLAQQQATASVAGVQRPTMFQPGGSIFNGFAQEGAQKHLGKMLLESSQVTGDAISTSLLPDDFASAVIMAIWPQLISPQLAASVRPMDSNTLNVYDYEYPLSDTDPFFEVKHFFGYVDHAAATTLASGSMADSTDATDDGALSRASGHIPSEAYAFVGQVPDADATVTITFTDGNGNTDSTAKATITTSNAVGDIVKFIPTVSGDKVMNVTAVSSSGWTSGGTGQVGIFVPQPLRGHTAGSPADSAAFKLKRHSIEETAYDIQTNLTLQIIEDMQKALSAGGTQGIELLGTMTTLLSQSVRDYLDRLALDRIAQNAFSRNKVTFNMNTPGAGYSLAEWRERLHYNMDVLGTTIDRNGGFAPNWMVFSSEDRADYSEALGKKLSPYDSVRNDPFDSGRAKYSLLNSSVWQSKNSPNERILMGSNNASTGLHIGVYIPFTILQGQDANKGFEQVVMVHTRQAIDVVSGRGIGVLEANRR